MFFGKIIACAALALTPFVSAQTRLAFTVVPGPFTIGKTSTIRWTGGQSDESVTLILRQGSDTSNLNTVAIIASNVNGTSYDWKPSSDLQPGDDYALQITQGLDGNNYSGLFTIQSAAAGAATTVFAVAGSSTIALATITPNLTSTVTMMAGTGTGTGAPLPRNTTMVSATLSTTATVTSIAGSVSPSASSTGGAIAAASAKAVMGLGAVAAAAMYLL